MHIAQFISKILVQNSLLIFEFGFGKMNLEIKNEICNSKLKFEMGCRDLKTINRWKPAVKYVELANGIVIDTGCGYKAIRKDSTTFWIEKFKPYCLEQVDEFLNGAEAKPIV